MNQKKIVVVLIVLALGAVLFVKQQKSSETVSDSQGSPTTANKGNTTADMFKDYIAKKTPTQCSYEYDNPAGNMVGTVYFVGEETMRADFTTTPQTGEVINSSMIRMGEDMYVWSSLSNVGTKLNLT